MNGIRVRSAHLAILMASLAALSACGGSGGESGNPAPAQTYTVGGSITGLASGASLVLSDNSSNALTISSNGEFVFTNALTSGSRYAVTVTTQPSGRTCSVSAGSGVVGAINVTNVTVSCKNDTYTIGGTIQGLSDPGLVLVNGSDTLKVAAGATSFTMPTAVVDGGAYSVIVQVHPTAVSCIVNGGAGTVTGADVTGISIRCGPGTESVLYSFFDGLTDGGGPNGSLIRASDGNLYGTTWGGGADDFGTIFKITPAGMESVLYSFAGPAADGAHPNADLIQASDGDFYGMTLQGGASTYFGTIFEFAPSGTETVLHSFNSGTTDGGLPNGNLVQASDGNFYGMTQLGGANGYGAVFKITPAGTETVLYSFKGGPSDGATALGSLIQASDGNLYGMTPDGGASNFGTIFRITPAGSEAVLYSFKGGASDGAGPNGDLIQASDGDFYGMTSQGGANNFGTVFKITPTGTETVLYSFEGGVSDGAGPNGDLIQASDGNFYGMTYGGGPNNFGTVFKITPSGGESVLYSFKGGPADGASPLASLIQTTDGNLYGMTQGGGLIGAGIVFEFN
jgi:uncharacterized repeat protein (TIGR03803 family)